MFSSDVNFKYCKFPESFETDELYTCTDEEKCCDVGCCVYITYKFYKFWYYWLILFVIFGIFSACSWFCKKSTEQVTTRRRRTNRNSNYSDNSCLNEIYAGSDCYPGCINYIGDVENVDSQIVLDQLLVSFRNRNNNNIASGASNLCEPPPDYNTLSKEIDSYHGPPPRYSSIFKFPPGNDMHQQNHEHRHHHHHHRQRDISFGSDDDITNYNNNDCINSEINAIIDDENSNTFANVDVHRRNSENGNNSNNDEDSN